MLFACKNRHTFVQNANSKKIKNLSIKPDSRGFALYEYADTYRRGVQPLRGPGRSCPQRCPKFSIIFSTILCCKNCGKLAGMACGQRCGQLRKLFPGQTPQGQLGNCRFWNHASLNVARMAPSSSSKLRTWRIL